MSPPEPSQPTIEGPGYANIVEAQGKDLQTNKMIIVLKEKMNKYLKEYQENKKNDGNE